MKATKQEMEKRLTELDAESREIAGKMTKTEEEKEWAKLARELNRKYQEMCNLQAAINYYYSE